MAIEYIKTISSNAIHTNGKENITISASGTLYNIYPVGKSGKKCRLRAASGATVVVDHDSGNIKMTSDFTMTQYDTLLLESDGTYWEPLGGKANNA